MSHRVGVGVRAPSKPLMMASSPLAGAEAAPPAEALFLDGRGLRFRPHMGGRARAVTFAEGVPGGDKRHGFLVIHGHTLENGADVPGRKAQLEAPHRGLGIWGEKAGRNFRRTFRGWKGAFCPSP